MFGVIPCTLAEAEEDRRDRHICGLFESYSPALSEVDHSKHLDAVQDQGSTSSCVGQWFSSAIYLAGQAQGKPVPRPSVRWSYAVARYTASPGLPLDDIGSNARLMCQGAERHGIVADSRLPFAPSKINEPPPFDADVAGADALFTGYYRADEDTDQLRIALEQGHFPGIAIEVHQDFVDWSSSDGVYDEPAGELRGYHEVTIVGYRPDAFLVLNSWGTNWGSGGFCWMSDRFLSSRYVFDRYVVTSSPIGR
jgi:C1A family cysteine protease